MPSFAISAPIGVFDSGIGGLSVLRALREELPHERFIYLADSGHAPYGEKSDEFVRARSLSITRHLRTTHAIKLLVVACNTATAAAVDALRSALPDLPTIGVEPALKPAAQISRTHHVGVLATRSTVASSRFARLREENSAHTRFSVQACDGLAHAIEQSTEEEAANAVSATKIRALCARYTGALGVFGIQGEEIDTLVLGCTHYVFALTELQTLVGPHVRIIDTAAAVARQTRRILEQHAMAGTESTVPDIERVVLYTTGSLRALQAAAWRWLALPAQYCTSVQIPAQIS